MEQKYLGITPYDEDSSCEFVGRSKETWDLYDRIIRNDFTVYYAASGEGKSSLIRAGLLPILRRRNYFPVYIVFEDKELEDLSAIENVINSRIDVESKKHEVTYEQSIWSKNHFNQEDSDQLKSDLWWRIRNYCFKRRDTELTPIFIFDQFEEVFTKANYNWTDHFFAWLEKISTDYPPDSLREIVSLRGIDMPTQKNFKALFSFRTEYLGDLDYWCVQKHFIPSLQDNRMCLKPLTLKGAQEIINLNKASLGEYADKIIQGCAESMINTSNDEQPCVYALILSVICQTLSEIPDNERIPLLDNLNNYQDDTIDDILLRFYKKKLLAVGLDYNKNEKIIADIEDALVDENGKRRRRDTNEDSMQHLAKWIELLSDKSNGLLKIIDKKEVNGHLVNTVEFPHDRLCKAIDSSKKERKGKILWKMNRQGEWMQFGIISTIIGIIAFLWNALIPSIESVITNCLSNTDFENVIKLFVSNYLQWEWKPSKYAEYTLDEGFSTLLMMVSLVLFIPLITLFISRKTKKWQILTALISFFSSLSFGFLWHKNTHISFANSYVTIFTFIGLLCSIASLGVSLFRLRYFYTKGNYSDLDKAQYSNWPLWGGYFIFASYLFYEFLFRTTFGVSEPKDSSFALIVLPLLYTFWAWGFYNMEFHDNVRKRMRVAYLLSIIFLVVLFYISRVPFNDSFKQNYGFSLSIVLILLWIAASVYLLLHSRSKTKYYLLSKSKRWVATILGALIIILTFILNLGYNPIAINPKAVCHVFSWKDVMVHESDSIAGKKLGILYSTNGEIIVPCNIPIDSKRDSLLAEGYYAFEASKIPIESEFAVSPLQADAYNHNLDCSLSWNSYNHILTAYLQIVPTLEHYLHRQIRKDSSSISSFRDSIDYYAAKLFCEIRKANIDFVVKGKVYNLEALESIEILDSLQHIALSKELSNFLLDSRVTTTTSGGRKYSRKRIEVLEDSDLIDFHCELSRSIMLCMIKDRVLQSDMPSLFTLANCYSIAYFTSVPAMRIHMRCTVLQNFTKSIKGQDKTTSKIESQKFQSYISSEDILNRRVFAWYDLFNDLCCMDMYWNLENYIHGIISPIKKQGERLKSLFNEVEEILPILISDKTSADNIIKDSKNTADLTHLSVDDLLCKLHKLYDPKYYESMLNSLEQITLINNILTVDQSLKQIKDDVFSTLLPLLKERMTGIYNNAFENICKNLLLVSAMRGNDIQNNAKEFSEYLTEKHNLYNVIVETPEDLIREKLELEEKLKEIIKYLTNH